MCDRKINRTVFKFRIDCAGDQISRKQFVYKLAAVFVEKFCAFASKCFGEKEAGT